MSAAAVLTVAGLNFRPAQPEVDEAQLLASSAHAGADLGPVK
jgi:hypothetical protein